MFGRAILAYAVICNASDSFVDQVLCKNTEVQFQAIEDQEILLNPAVSPPVSPHKDFCSSELRPLKKQKLSSAEKTILNDDVEKTSSVEKTISSKYPTIKKEEIESDPVGVEQSSSSNMDPVGVV